MYRIPQIYAAVLSTGECALERPVQYRITLEFALNENLFRTKGTKLVVFPEGTRNPAKDLALLPFKKVKKLTNPE